MKWLFIVAVLLNAVFFAYNSFFEKKGKPLQSVSKVVEKNQIVLLSELDANGLKNLQTRVIPQKSVQAQKTQIESFAETSETELAQGSQTNGPDNVSENNMSQLVEGAESRCFKLGPFNKEELDNIRLTLEKAYPKNLSFRIETTSETTYYRIYIPPVESKEVRNDTLALLDKHGLEDNYVMSIDGRKNAIALGVFKKRSAAETIADKASKIGIATTIEAISDDKNSLYKLQLVFQKNFDMKAFNEMLEKNKLESLKCEK